MIFKQYFVYLFAISSFSGAVKVNMHGSLSLGQEVMDTIFHFFRSGYSPLQFRSGRRSFNTDLDPMTVEIEAASLCKNLQFCKGNLETFVKEYVTALAKTIDSVFDGIVNAEVKLGLKKLFFGKLSAYINNLKKILKVADEKITEDREAYIWVGVIKKISAKFQKKAITYVFDKVEADLTEIDEIKKKLTQSLVINIASAESRAQKSLCIKFHICLPANDCTTALNAVLARLRKLPQVQIKRFMQALYKALADTTFYSKLAPETSKAFQVILKDMSQSDSVPTKEILSSVQNTVETRLNSMHTDKDLQTKGQDVELVHIILSDMDYLYSKHKSHPLHSVLDDFLDWAKNGGKISQCLKDTIVGLQKVLSSVSDDLVNKLINEVRVFLEITVDPEE